ncbi:molybdopterin-dependent oxidoreductase [Campylobacter jejuni]
MHDILSDESLCECIVDINVTRTPSNNYADYILPDATMLEQEDFIRPSAGYHSNKPYIIYCQKAIGSVGKAKPIYKMCLELAKRLGIEKEFSEGRTHSSFWEIPQIREANPQEIWINTIDAEQRSIKRAMWCK